MSRRAHPARICLPLCVILLLSACQSSPSSGSSSISPRLTRVEVHSNHWENLTVYLERDGVRSRLGAVGGNASRMLKVPEDLLAHGGWVRLVAVETGRRDHAYSELFSLESGGSATWRTGPGDHPTPVGITPPL